MCLKLVSLDLYNTVLGIQTDEESLSVFRDYSCLLKSEGISIPGDELMQGFQTARRRWLSKTPPGREISLKQVFREIFVRAQAAVTADRLDKLVYLFRVASRTRIAIEPGVSQALRNVRDEFRLCLVSDAQVPFIYPELRMFGLDKVFHRVLVSEELGYVKSSGKPFEILLKLERILPRQVLHLGDDPATDGMGCKETGIPFLRVKHSGGNSREGIPLSEALSNLETLHHRALHQEALTSRPGSSCHVKHLGS